MRGRTNCPCFACFRRMWMSVMCVNVREAVYRRLVSSSRRTWESLNVTVGRKTIFKHPVLWRNQNYTGNLFHSESSWPCWHPCLCLCLSIWIQALWANIKGSTWRKVSHFACNSTVILHNPFTPLHLSPLCSLWSRKATRQECHWTLAIRMAF